MSTIHRIHVIVMFIDISASIAHKHNGGVSAGSGVASSVASMANNQAKLKKQHGVAAYRAAERRRIKWLWRRRNIMAWRKKK